MTQRDNGEAMKLLSGHPSGFTIKDQPLDLKSLVSHREAVNTGMTVETVYAQFQNHGLEYVGVMKGRCLVGVVSRGHVGFLLGSRFGFAIYGRQPVSQHLLPRHLAVTLHTPLVEVLDLALSREGEEFYDDVALVDAHGAFKGIIQVQTLVRLQTRLIVDTTGQIETQRKTLAERNKALTESLGELRRSQGRYDILFKNTVLGVAMLNRIGQVESHNHRFAVLLGLESNITSDRPLNLGNMIVPADRQAFTLMVKRQEEDGEEEARPSMAHSGEFRLQLPRLGIRQFKIFVSWIGETGQISVLLEDVSEQRMLERELAQKEKSNLLESLVGGIAHELNNKLTPIVMFAELIAEELKVNTDPALVLTSCDAMRKSAMEASRIIRQLLQLSKPAKMETARCDLREIVDDTTTILNHRLRQVNATLESALPAEGIFVQADPQQIKQVLVNLMINGIDALEGRPRRCLRIEGARENGCWHLTLSDTGVGIEPKNLTRVFDPFFTTKSPDRGTGLGLSVCYNIIKAHGGELTIQSVLGEGTQVRVRLPAATETSPMGEPNAAPAPVRSAPQVRGALSVLIVDDEDAIALMLRTIVQRNMGCQAEWVENGEVAIQRLQEATFDLIISDVRMPHVSGLDLFRWVREHRPELGRRFVFITGDAGSLDLNAEIETLGVPVLRKPFPMEVFLTQCELLLKT